MINPEELMIGNYLKCGFDKETLLEVTSISKNGFSAHRVGEENKSLHKEAWDGDPIPLTEEILLKCGFEKVRYEKYAHKKLNKLRVFPHTMKDGFGIYIMGAYTLPHIKHLHELQNLYFSLTGKQLRYEQTITNLSD